MYIYILCVYIYIDTSVCTCVFARAFGMIRSLTHRSVAHDNGCGRYPLAACYNPWFPSKSPQAGTVGRCNNAPKGA